MNVWIITVNYKKTDLIKKLIISLENCKKIENIKLLVADNESNIKSEKKMNAIIGSSSLDIDLFTYDKNLFYWPAANETLKKNLNSLKKYPDWVMICNNDIVFHEKNFFINLKKYDIKKYHVIGPKILNQNNDNLNPFKQNPLNQYEIFFWNLYFKSYIISRLLNFLLKKFKLKKKNDLINNSKEVYAVHGSAILFSKFFFKKNGFIDPEFRLFGEELTTAEIAKKIGCKIFYKPDLVVKHNEHSSVKNINKKDLFYLARESHRYFLNKYLKK